MSETQGLLQAAAIVVHEREHADAALDAATRAGRAVILLSPGGASAYMGAGYFRAMIEAARRLHPGAQAVAVLDCGERAGEALGAFREGIEAVCFGGPPEIAGRLRDIADRRGATLLDARPEALDLACVDDMAGACRSWLRTWESCGK